MRGIYYIVVIIFYYYYSSLICTIDGELKPHWCEWDDIKGELEWCLKGEIIEMCKMKRRILTL